MNFRIRLSLNELETRETPSGIDPIDPAGGPTTPATTPGQTSPPTGGSTPVIPPVDPTGR